MVSEVTGARTALGHAGADYGLSERRKRLFAENAKLQQHYRKSKAAGAAYHTAVDFIRTQQA